MRLTPVRRAVGARLARDLPATAGGIPLLRTGALVTERFATVLARDHGIHAVWVDDELSAGIEPAELLPEPVRAETAAGVARSLQAARDAFASRQAVPPAVVGDLHGVVDRITSSLVRSADAALAIYDLAAADQYTHRHSIDVAALGLLIARAHFARVGWTDFNGRRRHDRIDERLATFGLGLLLHDVGKMAVPADVLNKPGALDEDEWALIRTHPEAGVALLPGSTSALVLTVVRAHHERWDGSGYPRGIAGPAIHELARIAAVADVYDAITSERPYKPAAPAHAGVAAVAEGAGTLFDPEVVETFEQLVFPHPVGTEVLLPDGRIGVVSQVDPRTPRSPVVRAMGPDGPEEVRVSSGLSTTSTCSVSYSTSS